MICGHPGCTGIHSNRKGKCPVMLTRDYGEQRKRKRHARNAEHAEQLDPAPPSAPGEMWLPVAGWAREYMVSSQARIWSLPRIDSTGRVLPGRIRRQQTHVKGHYHMLTFWRDGVPAFATVHKLVAEAFLGPCPEGQEVRHGPRKNPDGSCCDWLDNLEYGTRLENIGDKVRDGTVLRGRQVTGARLSEAQVQVIRALYAIGTGTGHPVHNSWCDHWSYARLAAAYDVSMATIGKVVRKETWTT